jgi:hypothetical protein
MDWIDLAQERKQLRPLVSMEPPGHIKWAETFRIYLAKQHFVHPVGPVPVLLRHLTL